MTKRVYNSEESELKLPERNKNLRRKIGQIIRKLEAADVCLQSPKDEFDESFYENMNSAHTTIEKIIIEDL